jgi:hypothetical protein
MTMTFKKAGLAAALLAGSAIVSPAMAATVNGVLAFPTLNGEVFAGAPGTKVGIELGAGGTLTADGVDISYVFYSSTDGTGTPLTTVSSTAVAANGAAGGDEITVPAGAKSMRVTMHAPNGSDDFGLGASYAALKKEDQGTNLYITAHGSQADAETNADVFTLDNNYLGLKAISAVKNDDNTTVYVTFNADVYQTGTPGPVTANLDQDSSSTAGENLVVLADATNTEAVANGVVTGSTLNGNIMTLQATNGTDALSPTPSKVVTGRGFLEGAPWNIGAGDIILSDGTSNTYLNAEVPIGNPQELDLAGSTAKVIAQGGAGLYDPAVGVGSVNMTVRFNQALKDTAVPTVADITVTANGTAFGVNATSIDVSGDTLTFTQAAPGSSAFFYKNGKLMLTDGTAEFPVSVTIADTTLQSLIGDDPLNDDVTISDVFAGTEPSVQYFTADTDTNGKLDGATVAFNTPVTLGGAAGFEMRVNGTTPTDSSDLDGGAITVAGAAMAAEAPTNADNPVASSAVNVTFNESGAFDWDADGTRDADDVAEYDDFTTADTSKYDIRLTENNSLVTYNEVYDPATGEVKKAAIASFAPVNLDGAAPVLLSAEFLEIENSDQFASGEEATFGQLKITTSEAMTANSPNEQYINIDTSTLQLFNLSADLSDDVPAALDPADTDGKTVLIGDDNDGISADVLGKTLSFVKTTSTRTSGIVGSGDSMDPVGAETIVAGEKVVAGPQILHAAAMRDANDTLNGNITKVVVQFDKEVALGDDDELQDGMFKLFADYGAGNIQVDIPASGVAGLNTNTLVLTLPEPGLAGKTLETLHVEYDAVGGNELVSNDTAAVAIADAAYSAPTGAEGRDADTSVVVFQDGSNKLYTMEYRGKLMDGSTNLPDNTLVRVDLVNIVGATTVKGMNVSVPCNCTGNSNVAVTKANAGDTAFTSLALQIASDAKAGKRSTTAYLKVNLSDNQDAVSTVNLLTAEPQSAAGDVRYYEVSINHANGQISGNGVRGSATITDGTVAVSTLETQWAVLKDGVFRVAIGQDAQPKGESFLIASYKKPGYAKFRQFTSAVKDFTNYVPFATNIVAAGAVGTHEVDVSKILRTGNDQDNGQLWDLVPFEGKFDFKRGTRGDVDVSRLLISAGSKDGDVYTQWIGDGESDEAFTMVNNATASAMEIGSTSINNIRSLNGGLALALNSSPTGISYPVTGDPSNALNAAGGRWSLVTFQADVDLNAKAADLGIGAVIIAGTDADGRHRTATWFADSDIPAAENPLKTIEAGTPAFVYFKKNSAFKFGN